eukprot:scaffold22754_cov104-Isochrysis_galbana.AAC.2
MPASSLRFPQDRTSHRRLSAALGATEPKLRSSSPSASAAPISAPLSPPSAPSRQIRCAHAAHSVDSGSGPR